MTKLPLPPGQSRQTDIQVRARVHQQRLPGARIVDQKIDPPERIGRRLRQYAAACIVGDIRLDRDAPSPTSIASASASFRLLA